MPTEIAVLFVWAAVAFGKNEATNSNPSHKRARKAQCIAFSPHKILLSFVFIKCIGVS